MLESRMSNACDRGTSWKFTVTEPVTSGSARMFRPWALASRPSASRNGRVFALKQIRRGRPRPLAGGSIEGRQAFFGGQPVGQGWQGGLFELLIDLRVRGGRYRLRTGQGFGQGRAGDQQSNSRSHRKPAHAHQGVKG